MKTKPTLPAFTADASLYQTSQRYFAAATSHSAPQGVVPQIPIGLCTKAAYYCNRGYQKWCDIEDANCNFDV